MCPRGRPVGDFKTITLLLFEKTLLAPLKLKDLCGPEGDDKRLLLHAAAHLGHEDMVSAVLAIDPTFALEMDEEEFFPVHCAAEVGNAAILRQLLEVAEQTMYAVTDHLETTMHCAARSKSSECLELLLRRAPALASSPAVDNVTPALCAAESGNAGLDMLLDVYPEGATTPDAYQMYPVFVASLHGHVAAVETLMRKAPSTADEMDEDHGYNSLHIAVSEGHAPVVDVLLRHRPSLATSLAANGLSALHLALAEYEKLDIPGLEEDIVAPIVRLLLDVSPSLATLRVPYQHHQDCVPLHIAAETGMEMSARELLRVAPHTISARNGRGETPLDCALLSGEHQVAQLLIHAAGQTAEEVTRSLHAHATVHSLELFVAAIRHFVPMPAVCWERVPDLLPGAMQAFPCCVKRGTVLDMQNIMARMTRRNLRTVQLYVRSLSRVCPSLPTEVIKTIVAHTV